jgi:hypothetical protein
VSVKCPYVHGEFVKKDTGEAISIFDPNYSEFLRLITIYNTQKHTSHISGQGVEAFGILSSVQFGP